MALSASGALSRLAALRTEFGPQSAAEKHELLQHLAAAALPTADAVRQLHDLLCFWHAYPDDPALRRRVGGMLAGFASRRDLLRHRDALADTGIAGTDVHYEFFMETARWLAAGWPARLHIDWDEYGEGESLEKILHLLALYAETPGLDEYAFPVREWLEHMKGPDETDATFVVRRLAEVPMDPAAREYFYEHLGLPLVLAGGPGGPCRTGALLAGLKLHPQTTPLQRGRPDLIRELAIPPREVKGVGPARGRTVIDLARAAMVARNRDLDAFAYASPHDVTLIDDGAGLQFAVIGTVPARRLLFEAVSGYLILQNGVPVGYGVISALLGSVELAFNVFPEFRGAAAGHVYARLLAACRHLYGADTFVVFPYQLGGDGNEEGLATGAWWFYQKLGFRAREPEVLKLMRRELRTMKTRPQHRTRRPVLAEMAQANVYLDLKRPRDDVIGALPLAAVGLHVTGWLARRFGATRARAEETCAREAATLLGVASRRGWSAGENLAWRRWGPLVLALGGVERWTRAEKAALVDVIRAKGGRREADFVRRFDAHRKLRRAVVRAARSGNP